MIRVLVAAHMKFICDLIRAVFEEEDAFSVSGCTSSENELLHLWLQCDVLLISANFKGNNTIDLVSKLHTKHRPIKFIVDMPDCPDQIMQFIEAGAAGYILKNESTDDLVCKVTAAVNGEAQVSGKVAAIMMKHINNLANPPNVRTEKKDEQIAILTHRQREVLELVSKGLTNKEIANKLHIECGTVKNHLHHILKKTGASNRHEAASLYQAYIPRNGALAKSRVFSTHNNQQRAKVTNV